VAEAVCLVIPKSHSEIRSILNYIQWNPETETEVRPPNLRLLTFGVIEPKINKPV